MPSSLTQDISYQDTIILPTNHERRFGSLGHAWTRLPSIGQRVDRVTNPPTAMNVNWEPAVSRGVVPARSRP